MSLRVSLPIDSVLPEIHHRLASGCRQLIVHASPGSGKTTRIPPALRGIFSGQIWILEPRRLAAKMSALRVRDELGPQDGVCVGWQMRHDTSIDERTRLLFLTEGMFPVRLAEDPTLRSVSCVILDEFHERHAQTDVAFALIRKLQETTRPDLVLIVMSATLDILQLQAAMPEAQRVDVNAPVFPVETLWWRGDPRMPLAEKITAGVLQMVKDSRHRGHILAFLPGTADMQRSADQLRRCLGTLQSDWTVLQLRASLERKEQESVFAEHGKRKVILATNIAESSITIPGVTAVVDSGLARVPHYDSWRHVTTLETRPVSQASIIQRSGRAGRTAPGLVLRLFSENDYAGRAAVETPDLLRADLSSIVLTLLGLDHATKKDWHHRSLAWLDPPPADAWKQAETLLQILGLTTEAGELQHPGLARWPLPPRLSRFLHACSEDGIGAEGAWLTALLADDIAQPSQRSRGDAFGCDLLSRYDDLRNASSTKNPALERAAQQYLKLIGQKPTTLKPAHELNLETALLKAFPDRIAKARKPFVHNTSREYALCTGGDAKLALHSSSAHLDWIIALEISETRSTGSAQSSATGQHTALTIDTASGIELETLLSARAPWVQARQALLWDEGSCRVRGSEQLTYGSLLLSEKRLTPDPAAAAQMLQAKLAENWPKPFLDDQVLQNFVSRQELMMAHGLIPHAWDLEELKHHLQASMCDNFTSFSEISARPLIDWLRDCVGFSEWQDVEGHAPREIKVGAGFSVPIHYPKDHAPWIEARLQNFFGQMETPFILQGRVALTVHLLAPNHRALQVTTDLASFWRTTYPQIRNEYMRKYPRHYWPENPAEAEPPVRGSLKPRI